MTRPIRHAYPGAIYHIINRGSRRDNIFTCDDDKKEFLSRLKTVCNKYHVIVFAYCLMDNHFHFLLQTPLGNISDVMRNFQGSYANWFRARHNLIGPLFQSRYKSVLVEDESYLVTLSAYIHLNPVRAKMVEQPEEYEWSSCASYLGESENELVASGTVLELSGGVENYHFILSSMTDNPPDQESVYGKFSILGAESFKENVVNLKYSNLKREKKDIDTSAQPEFRKLLSLHISEIEEVIKSEFNISKDLLYAKKKGNVARKMCMYFMKKYTTMMNKEIADYVGMKAHSAGQLIRYFEKEIREKEGVGDLVVKVEKRLYEK